MLPHAKPSVPVVWQCFSIRQNRHVRIQNPCIESRVVSRLKADCYKARLSIPRIQSGLSQLLSEMDVPCTMLFLTQ